MDGLALADVVVAGAAGRGDGLTSGIDRLCSPTSASTSSLLEKLYDELDLREETSMVGRGEAARIVERAEAGVARLKED